MEENNLEKYGNIYTSMGQEGDGYYFYGYESAKTFDFDPELKALFVKACEGIEEFKQNLEQKIKEEGGDPEDFEA